MAAFRAGRYFGARFLRVEMIAADAVKRDFSPLRIIEIAIAPIVVNPHKPKHAQHQQAINDDIQGIIGRKHDWNFSGTAADAKGK